MSSKFQLGGSLRASRSVVIVAAAMLSSLAVHAHAAERVTLSNGFVEQIERRS